MSGGDSVPTTTAAAETDPISPVIDTSATARKRAAQHLQNEAYGVEISGQSPAPAKRSAVAEPDTGVQTQGFPLTTVAEGLALLRTMTENAAGAAMEQGAGALNNDAADDNYVFAMEFLTQPFQEVATGEGVVPAVSDETFYAHLHGSMLRYKLAHVQKGAFAEKARFSQGILRAKMVHLGNVSDSLLGKSDEFDTRWKAAVDQSTDNLHTLFMEHLDKVQVDSYKKMQLDCTDRVKLYVGQGFPHADSDEYVKGMFDAARKAVEIIVVRKRAYYDQQIKQFAPKDPNIDEHPNIDEQPDTDTEPDRERSQSMSGRHIRGGRRGGRDGASWFVGRGRGMQTEGGQAWGRGGGSGIASYHRYQPPGAAQWQPWPNRGGATRRVGGRPPFRGGRGYAGRSRGANDGANYV
jgi:hypothetical protein